jgi:hypothetical protein
METMNDLYTACRLKLLGLLEGQREAVAEARRIEDAFAAAGGFPPGVVSILPEGVHERLTGNLIEKLEQIGREEERRAARG